MADHNLAQHALHISEVNTSFTDKLANYASQLRERFEEVRGSFIAKLSTEEGRASLRWTAHDQRSQYNLYQLIQEAEKVRAAYTEHERARRDEEAEAQVRLLQATLRGLGDDGKARVDDGEEDWGLPAELDDKWSGTGQDERVNTADYDSEDEEE